MNKNETEDQKYSRYAWLMLGRVYTDHNRKKLGLPEGFDENAETCHRRYARWGAFGKWFWILLIGGIMITAGAWYLKHNSIATTTGILTVFTAAFVRLHRPRHPGTNVVLLGKSWTPHRKRLEELGVHAWLSDSLLHEEELCQYIGSGMTYSFREREGPHSAIGRGWLKIEAAFKDASRPIKTRIDDASREGHPKELERQTQRHKELVETAALLSFQVEKSSIFRVKLTPVPQ